MPDTFLQQRHAAYKTSHQDIAVIISKTLNDEIEEFLPVNQGYDNQIFAVKTKKNGDMIVRIGQHGITAFEQEEWAIRQAKSLGVPVPYIHTVQRFEIAGELKDVMVMQKADGKPLSELRLESSQLQYVCKQLGVVLSKLQSKHVAGFGFLKAENKWEFESWQRFVTATLQEREEDAPFLLEAGLSEKEASSLLHIVGELKLLEHQKPVLCHGDLSFSHIFIDADFSITALIDWGMCRGDMRALDTSALLIYHPEIDLSWILEGYHPVSEKKYERELLVQQANALMAMMSWDVREGRKDDLEKMVQAARLVLEN